jgi:hypothetical protein
MFVKSEEARSFAQGAKTGHPQRNPQGGGGYHRKDCETISDTSIQ